MTKTVIVPLDGSDFALRALPVATAAAGAFDAELLLVTTPMTLEEHDPSELPVWLPEAAAATGYDRVRTELLPEHDELTALSRCVARVEEPALCMATRGRGALGTAVLGSVAQRAVHELGVPTALVGPNSDSEWRLDGPIVVCHDGSVASDAILPAAREWAEALRLKVVIVHVSRPRVDCDPIRAQPRRSTAPCSSFVTTSGTMACDCCITGMLRREFSDSSMTSTRRSSR